jgi:bacillolysin
MNGSRWSVRLGGLLWIAPLLFLSGCQRKTASLQDIAEPIASPGWVTFKAAARVNPTSLFRDYARAFHLAAGNEMRLVSQETDSLGFTHHRYQQYFNGVEVENAVFVVHAKGNTAVRAGGRLLADFERAGVQPTLSEQQALEILKRHIPADRYFHEDNLVGDLDSPAQPAPAPYFPRGRLILTEDPASGDRVLAWMFRAYVMPLGNSRQAYIDARDGRWIKDIPLVPACFAGGGNTTFRGNQHFNTGKANIPSFGERFILLDDCHGNRLHLINWNTGGDTREIFDSDNDWNGNDMPSVTSFWALGIAYDYYDLVLHRKSYDNKNGNMTIINDPTLGNQATGGNGSINIGLGSTSQPTDDYNTVDIVGHEFTHSVVGTSAKLSSDTTKESAALTESFCDIFGKMTLRWEERNVNPEWVIGAEKGCAGGAICRDMKNPKALSQPDTYQGSFWMSANIDPHVNGSVQNRWFSLVSDGGSGTNTDLKTPYSVSGIGIAKATQIAYRALTRYLFPGAAYTDTRDATISAAQDLHGFGSPEEGEVTKAWCAVGLCPYKIPTQPDIFDQPGKNPNPASPDHNDTAAGATPLGTGAYLWSNATNPRLQVPDLSIYPIGDVDFFKISFPETKGLTGRCFSPGYSFSFGTPVDASIFVNGKVIKSVHESGSIFVDLSQTQQGDFILRVGPAFPGQILQYALDMTYYVHFDQTCFQPQQPTPWDRFKECIMCNFGILSPGDPVILDPFYRTKDGVERSQYFFNWDGEGGLRVPVQVLKGNQLQVELVDSAGRVVATGNRANDAGIVTLEAPTASKGVYSVRFSGFGNGTELKMGSPAPVR